MCLIIYAKDNRPKDEYIENGDASNADGIGMAWKENGYLRYKKGLTVDETKELAATLPLGYVIHFRMASVGGKDERLIHPFPVRLDAPLKQCGKANKLLFHNGHWSEWKAMLINHLSSKITLPDGIWSDTRAIALLTAIHGKSFLKVIAGTGTGNHAGRFILMTPTNTSVIGNWDSEDGVYYSNSGYKWSYNNSRSVYDTQEGYWSGGNFVRTNRHVDQPRYLGCE